MKIISALPPFLMLFTLACTSSYGLKNKATLMSAEKFDKEVIALSKDQYPDPEQQKVFADFIKKNSRIEVSNVEIKDETATADLAIWTPKQSVYPELKVVSGKVWKAKIDANMETRKYTLSLKKINKSWEITEQKAVPAK